MGELTHTEFGWSNIGTGHLNRTRSNGLKLKREELTRLGIRRNFVMMRVVEHGSRLTREGAESPSLDISVLRLKYKPVWIKPKWAFSAFFLQ